MDDQANAQFDQSQPLGQKRQAVASGLSGNEMYCAALLGMRPGNIMVGNCVYSMGVFGQMKANIRTTIGGEISSFTDMIGKGRASAFEKLKTENLQAAGCGVTGVSNELVFHDNNIEFLSIGSAVHQDEPNESFYTSADAQELFCMVDAGYQPVSFVFGNVAYSIGVGNQLLGSLRQLGHGEVTQFSNVFNKTRNLALQRIKDEAKALNARAVVGIETTIVPFGSSVNANSVHEMVMIGTAANHPIYDQIPNEGVITSDLTAEETWNIAKMGYVPIELVLGTSVYSLGVAGSIKSGLKELFHGEVNTLSEMIYGARETSIARLREQADAVNADDILGIKTYIYQLGSNLVELIAIGTAVKKVQGLQTRSAQLPPQATTRVKKTFINTAETHFGYNLNPDN